MARKRRVSQSALIKQSAEFFKKNSRALAGIILFFAIIALAFIWLNGFLKTSSCFDCGEIEIIKFGADEKPLDPQKDFFKLSRPVNIFEADSLLLSRRIKDSHPEFQNVVITKYLPDRITAMIVDRRPAAKIKIGKFHIVDLEGVVLPLNFDSAAEKVPFITGLESRLFDPKVGARVNSRRLASALNALWLISTEKDLKGCEVSSVDMSCPEKANLKMDGITVILGDCEFEARLNLLGRILKDPKIDKLRINSIDLRFTDVVINTASEKK
ncbi:MAG: cell division protein FtsQ/DivIB [Candidatus Omnitrophota bacterium]